jgi:hypothetical protein
VKTRLIRIRNSRRTRLSKGVITQTELTDEVDLAVREGPLLSHG